MDSYSDLKNVSVSKKDVESPPKQVLIKKIQTLIEEKLERGRLIPNKALKDLFEIKDRTWEKIMHSKELKPYKYKTGSNRIFWGHPEDIKDD